jgi:thiol-disulfide isomerase/thioredoxin
LQHQEGEAGIVRISVCALLLAVAVLALSAPAPLRPLDEKAYTQLTASHQGSVLLVDFWATWCPPCREELPQLIRLARDYRSRGLRLVTISCDEPEDQSKAAQFLTQNGAADPGYRKQVAEDEAFIDFVDKKWSGALPALFLYDRSGRLARSFIGETDISTIEQAIQKLL